MNYIDFKGRTNLLGKPADWDEGKNGPCGALPVRIRKYGATGVFTSYWQPSEADIANILAGGVVELNIYGGSHPPVMLQVVEKPK